QAGGALRVAGTVNKPATVTVQGTPATVTSDNHFAGTAPVSAGTNTFTIVAVDASGNTKTQSYSVGQTGGSRTLSYDANGNLTSDGTRTCEWDALNELTAVNTGTHRVEYSYDGRQRRVRQVDKENGVVQSDKKIVWCQVAICEERAADGATVLRQLFRQG